MFKTVLLATCLCAFTLCSRLQQQAQIQTAFHATRRVPENTPVKLSVGTEEYDLQLLPDQGGVRVKSYPHPLNEQEYTVLATFEARFRSLPTA